MRQAISSGKSLDSCLKENNHRILVINGGSSSIKFAVFDQANDLKCILSGGIEQIGLSEPRLHAKGFDDVHNFSQVVTAPDHSSAAVVLMEWIESRHLADGLSAVGHRVVHGGHVGIVLNFSLRKYCRTSRI